MSIDLTDDEVSALEREYAEDDSTIGLGDYLGPEYMSERRAMLKRLFAEVRRHRAHPLPEGVTGLTALLGRAVRVIKPGYPQTSNWVEGRVTIDVDERDVAMKVTVENHGRPVRFSR